MERCDSSFWDLVSQLMVCSSFCSILPFSPAELCWGIFSMDLTGERCLMTGASSG